MPLSREYYRSLQERAKHDSKFKNELLTKAMNSYLVGNYSAGKKTLRCLIHATIGFISLSKEVKKSSKSIHRMLSPRGNPNTENFFEVVSVLQRRINVHLTTSIAKKVSR